MADHRSIVPIVGSTITQTTHFARSHCSQLEAELTAFTEQSNANLSELSARNDELHEERTKLEEILQQSLRETASLEDGDKANAVPSVETLRQNEQYLYYELQQAVASYVAMNEQLIELQRKITELAKRNKILANRLRENGLDSAIQMPEASGEMATIPRMAQDNQGILKYDNQNRTKILQRLIVELTPRVAITLLPGLPAYIVFMCIRYTDLQNSDNDVRSLLTDFIKLIKKVYRQTNTCETRILWLVNCIK